MSLRYVGPTGPRDSRLAFVGEAPGGEEEMQGIPFVGPAGNELGKMMHDANISRSSSFITNVCRFRPPGNDIEQFILEPKKRQPIPPGFVPYQGKWVRDFLISHIQDLAKELKEVNPTVISALGGTALWALTGKEGISNWRGSIIPCILPGCDHIKVVPTYHPAGILRNWADRWDAVQDFRRLMREAQYPEIRIPAWRFSIRPSFKQAVDFLQWLISDCNGRRITCDIETSKGQIDCVGIGFSKLDAFCIPILCKDRPEGYWSLEEEVCIINLLSQLLTMPVVKIMNHNYIYDSFYMAMLWGFKSIPWFDTMTGQHVCFPGKEKSLAYCASMYCDYYSFWKEDGRTRNPKVPDDNHWVYNCRDCVHTYEVSETVIKNLHALNLWEQSEFQMSLFEPVLDMMIRGVRTNRERRLDLAKVIEGEMNKRKDYLEQLFGHPVNPRSHPALKKLFYDDLRIKPVISRKTHKPCVDDDALDLIGRREIIIATGTKAIQEYRSLGIFKSNFLEADGPIERLFCNFNTSGAETFRWSSSTNPFGWGTNLQNVPREQDDEDTTPLMKELSGAIRKIFIPDEGMMLAEFDLARADLQVVVWESNDEDLKRKCREGADIHAENAKDVGMIRQKAKTFVHLTNYGGTARTAAISCGITVHAAELGQRRWFSAHPGILDWHKRVEASLNTTRCVYNKFGFRRFYFDRVDSVFKEALAWVPQSTVGLVIDRALLNIWRKLGIIAGCIPPVELLLQIHDSLVMQFLIPAAEQLLPEIQECMKVVVPYDDPLIIGSDCKISTVSWGDAKKWVPTPILIPELK